MITFQDRTESEALKRQLDDAIGLTDTLRAQSHEFANRLHTVVGLVELGHYDEAIQFVTEVSTARADLTERLQARICDAKLVALILAKVSLADERDVQLRVMDDSHVLAPVSGVSEVLTVAGNLIDNAVDAAAQAQARPRWVELTIVAAEHDLLIRVRDSGPGVPHDMREAIFTDGVHDEILGHGRAAGTGARAGPAGGHRPRRDDQRRPRRRRGVHRGPARMRRRGRPSPAEAPRETGAPREAKRAPVTS